MAIAFPTIAVSQTTSRNTDPLVNAVRFGNGYEQRVPMGINYKRDTWAVTWDGLTVSERNTIVAFIEAISDGTVTTWTSPFDTVQKKYVLNGAWSMNDTGGNIYSISINLRQVFDLT